MNALILTEEEIVRAGAFVARHEHTGQFDGDTGENIVYILSKKHGRYILSVKCTVCAVTDNMTSI